MCYRTVAQHLKRELTLYGIRYRDPGANPVASLEVLATQYLRQIGRAQPHGPYALLGYSIGGTLAYEIARQLRAQGEDVAVLAIIDTPNYAADASFWRSFSKTALRHVLAWLRAMTLNYKLAFVYSNLKQLLQSEGGLLSFLRAQKQMQDLMMKYKPEAYDGELVLFRAERRLFTLDGNLGWGGLARRIQAHDIAGNHISILSVTNARPIAEQLNRLA
jgi:thioesterase domain-containing protein